MRSHLGLALILGVAAGTAQAADHLLITEFVVTPTAGEFIELYNPTASSIDLTNYYLSDDVAHNDNDYAHLVDGTASVYSSDFIARFPAGASIAAGEFAVISMTDDSLFTNEYGSVPDFEINDYSGGADAVADMVDPGGLIGSSAGLTNSGEMVVLFYWDGNSDLLQDVDYAVWGDRDEGIDKTGLAIDGPDADTVPTTYAADTAIASQTSVAVNGGSGQPHDFGFSAARAFPFDEVGETAVGGNGLTGNDETSEELSLAGNWNVHAAPSPGYVNVDAPPSISNLAYSPCIPLAGEAVTVSADVIDDNLDTVSLLTSLDGGATFDTTAMVNTVGDTYEGLSIGLPAGFTVTFKVYATDTGGNEADTWMGHYVVETMTSINAIQSDTTTDGASNYDGQAVNVEGYVTAASGALSSSYFYISQSTTAAAWEGIKVFAPAGPAVVAEGDWVEIGGRVDEYYGETEIIAADDIDGVHDCVMVVSSDATDIKPLVRTSGVLADEAYEGVLVTVNDGAAADTMNTYGEWLVDDGTGSLLVTSAAGYSYVPAIGDDVDVTGVIGYAYGSFRLQPRDDNDFDEVAFNIQLVQYDNVIGPGDTYDEYVTLTNGTTSLIHFDAVDLEYVGPPTGSVSLFSGNANFPAGMTYSTTASLPIPAIPPATFETTTVVSDGGTPIASDGATVVATPTDADVTVPTHGAGTPARKINGGGTVTWNISVKNTSAGSQTLTALTAHLEHWSHAAAAWVAVEDVAVFSGSQVLAPGGSSSYNASVTLNAAAMGGRYRVQHEATFASGIDSQVPTFIFRNDS
jgi:hypothetical protein